MVLFEVLLKNGMCGTTQLKALVECQGMVLSKESLFSSLYVFRVN